MSTDVSSVVKHFPSAENGFTTTLASSISSGAATVPLNSVAGYSNGEVAVFVVDPSDASKKQTFTGTIDTAGVQVTSVVWTAGTNQAHSAGATVVDYASATHISMMTKGLLVEHAQTGLHTLTSNATITSSKVITGLNDTNGNEIFKVGATGSAVNEVTLTNAATGNSPDISASGGDTNVGLTLTPKGTGNVSMTKRADGWVTGLTAPSTVTALGRGSYSVVVNSTDYTDRLSPGMRLRFTRTVTAPTQCTDLESGSSQYYSKSSPNKMTFTDDFVCSAWIKLESYPAVGALSIIASRTDGSNGWFFGINEQGQIILSASNAAAGNYSRVLSYQAVPLSRWVHVAAQLDMSAFTATTTTSYTMFDGVDIPAQVVRAGTNPTAMGTQTGSLLIGAFVGPLYYFDGKLAQVAIYSAKVPQATILASIDRTLTGSETSLASAYSFNNSIADLNTSTPNDLTAQNSAVATNADSPFGQQADGTTAGTTEYGIITKMAFSTNTTITVQVPEGNALPTTGGVSAMSYSTQKIPLNFPTQKSKWRVISTIRSNIEKASPASSTWYSQNTDFVVPIGSWDVQYQGGLSGTKSSTTYGPSNASISSSASAVTNPESTTGHYHLSNVASIAHIISLNGRLSLDLTSATTHYAIVSCTTGSSDTGVGWRGDITPLVINMDCAYL